MPRKRSVARSRRRGRPRRSKGVKRGRGKRGGMRRRPFRRAARRIRRWGTKTNRWLKKTKTLSQAGKLYSQLGLPYGKAVGVLADFAGQKGYGLRLAGAGISPSGGSGTGYRRGGMIGGCMMHYPRRRVVRRVRYRRR